MDMVITVMDMEKDIMDINKSNMKIKTYVINLKDSVDRRETVLAELAKYPLLNVELVEAVDGRKMKPEERKSYFDIDKFVNRYHFNPKAGEIGCTLSHRICYRKLLESDEEFALIVEDDVNFLYPEDIDATLIEILNKHKDDKPYFITLGMHYLYYPKKYCKLSKYTLYKIHVAYGTFAYLINRKATERLLSVSLPFTVADDYPFIRKCGILVEGIYPTFTAGASTQETIPTEIQQESIQYTNAIKSYIIFWRKVFCYKFLSIQDILAKRSFIRGINE